MAKKIYAIQKGKVPGIYETWEDAQKQINGFSGAIYKSFKDTEIDLAKEYVNGGIVKSSKDKEKYYVVLKGHKEGVFDNWDEARQSIENYPNASYKSFKSKEMAELAFKEDNLNIMSKLIEENIINNYDYAIFSDGGTTHQTGISAYAYLVLKVNGKKVDVIQSEAIASLNGTNNSMEFSGLNESIKFLLREEVKDKKIVFYLDSKFTIESVLGKFKQSTLKDLSVDLYNNYDKLKINNKLELIHINSHIGIKYNEAVDKMIAIAKDNFLTKQENQRILDDYSR